MNHIATSLVALSGEALPLLLDVALKASLLLGLAGLATIALRKVSAATRHFVWLLAMAAVFVMPFLSALLPGWHVLPRWSRVAQPILTNGEARITTPVIMAFTPTPSL